MFSPHYHGVPVTRLRRVARQPYRQLARRAIASADMAVCVSGAEASALRTSVPELKQRIRVVPAGADAAAIHAAEPYPVTKTTIVSMGPIEHGKRLDRVISTLPDLGPDYELVIVGYGPERRPLAMHAHDLGVASQVRFVGPLDDPELFRWLRSAHVVVSMAEEAMSGATLLEAACAGVPVVASDIPAHLETTKRLPAGAVKLVSSQASPLVVADEIKAAVARGPSQMQPSVMTWEEAAALTTGCTASSSRPASGRRRPPSRAASVRSHDVGDRGSAPGAGAPDPGRLHRGGGVVAYRLGRIAEHVTIQGRWLDCGCADGYYAAGLLEAGASEVVGSDIAADRVEEAARLWEAEPRLSFVATDPYTLPFPDDSFDAVLLNEVMEHVADQDASLSEVRRILRDDGVLVIFSPNRWFPFEGHGVRIGRLRIGMPTPLVPWLPSRVTASWLNARNYWPHQLAGVVSRNDLHVDVVDFALPLFTKYQWMPERVATAYRDALPRLGRWRAVRRFGVSTMVVARKRRA